MGKWLSIFSGTVERPSPSDIIPRGNISVIDWEGTTQIVIDYEKPLMIPFTKPPKILPIMEIPDTNSMDGLMDIGNSPLYIEPADQENHRILVDWLAKEWITSKGKNTNDCVYRIMVNMLDNPRDFSKPHKFYAVHRIIKVGQDKTGRYFIFKGINNSSQDPYRVRDSNILFLNTGVIY